MNGRAQAVILTVYQMMPTFSVTMPTDYGIWQLRTMLGSVYERPHYVSSELSSTWVAASLWVCVVCFRVWCLAFWSFGGTPRWLISESSSSAATGRWTDARPASTNSWKCWTKRAWTPTQVNTLVLSHWPLNRGVRWTPKTMPFCTFYQLL